MPLSPWVDVATIREATCDHVGSTSTIEQAGRNMRSCSVCLASWPVGSNPPTTVLRTQEALPGKHPVGSGPTGPMPGPVVKPQ